MLNTLHISDKRIANPSFRFNLDSCVLRKYAASHLGDLLSKQGFILVNQYGAEGSVNAARIAGMPADYVTVEWNGVKLNSPSLGMADLSLIPGFFIDDVQISDRPKSAGQHAQLWETT
ncbi:MAG: TonB-dependent receptor [Bacteroidota bacterium]